MKSIFIRVYLATIAHSTAYGISFLLPLRISEIGGNESHVGQILGVAMISALISGVLTGHLTDLMGRIWAIVIAAIMQLVALLLIALALEFSYSWVLIGVCFGFGWAVFYLLTPIFTIKISPDDQRVKFLTIVSGLMMLGIGLGPVTSRIFLTMGISVTGVFIFAACLSGISAILFSSLRSTENSSNDLMQGSASLSLRGIRAVFSTDAALPIIMISIGGAIFGCLTNYQTVIAEAKAIDFSLFFAVFVITVVIVRLGLASKVNAQAPYPTAVVLQLLMCAALASYSYLPQSNILFIVTTAVFGIGYGLTYSVLNGVVANIKETDHLQAALLIFPLAYFIGLYGFPFIGGWLLVSSGVTTLLVALMFLGLCKLCCAIYGFNRVRNK